MNCKNSMFVWNERFVSLSTSMKRSMRFLEKAVCNILKLWMKSTSVLALVLSLDIGTDPGCTLATIWQYTTPEQHSSTFWKLGWKFCCTHAVSSLRPTK